MPDSSPHSHTHLGNFCAMSIWFSLPLNLPASDPEKVQVRNAGGKNRGDGQNRKQGVALGGRGRGEGTTGKWESQRRLGPVAGRGPFDILQNDNDKARARKPEEAVPFNSGH